MVSIQIDRLDGLSSSTAVKGPARCATTTNITLSDLQTIDGVALADGDRVLVRAQTDAKDNGIYVASTGNWRRSKDFSSNRDVRKGTMVVVTDGAVHENSEWIVTTENPVVFDTSNITFVETIFIYGDEEVKTASYAISIDDYRQTIVANNASPITFTLPEAADADATLAGQLWEVRVFNAGAGALTIDGAGAETINGQASISLVQNVGAVLWTDGSTWRALVVEVGNGTISTAKLADLAVTTAKIVDAAVTKAKLANASVSPAKMETPLRMGIDGLKVDKISTNVLRIYEGHVFSSDGSLCVQNTPSYDIDMSTTGVGGLDTGAPVGLTDYFVYVLRRDSDGAFGAVISSSITYGGVVLPAGYTHVRKLRFGFVYNSSWDGIPNFDPPNWPWPTVRLTGAEASSLWRALNAGTATTNTAFSLANWVPDNARLAMLMVRVTCGATAGTGYITSSGAGHSNGIEFTGIANSTYTAYVPLIRVSSTLELEYKVTGDVSLTVFVLGYAMTEPS